MSMARCQPSRLISHVGIAQLLRRGEGDRVDQKIEPAVGLVDGVEQPGDVVVLLHVAGQEDLGLMRLDQLRDAALARRARAGA